MAIELNIFNFAFAPISDDDDGKNDLLINSGEDFEEGEEDPEEEEENEDSGDGDSEGEEEEAA